MLKSFIPPFIICFIIITTTSLGQYNRSDNKNGSDKALLIGIIKDTESNKVVEFATVTVFNSADSTLVTGNISDSEGKFKIPVDPGSYYVIIEFIGYEKEVIENIEVDKSGGLVRLGEIVIEEKAEILSEVEIVADKGQTTYSIDKRVYNVDKDLSNLANNASDILDNIPSVQVDGDGNVSLRGSENVRILIDGKPSGLVGIGSVDALRNLQGDLIERIEVITNPSARYDAEGEAGIINIILKKKKNPGFNASFTANTGYPNNHGFSTSLNKRQNNFNIFLSGGVNYRRSPGNGYSDQTFFEEDTTFSFITERDQLRGGISGNVRLGVDYYLTKNTTVTVSGLYDRSEEENEVDLNYLDFDANGDLVRHIRREQDEEEFDENLEFDLGFRRTFNNPGQTLTFDFKWTDNEDVETADINEFNVDDPVDTLLQRTKNTENQETLFIQSDYVHPFEDRARVEAGYRFTNRIIDNDFLVEEAEEGTFEPVEGFDNTFGYDEWIYAVYAQGLYRFGEYSVQAGLRVEHTDIFTESIETNDEVRQVYTDFFPSVFFSRKFSKESSAKFSYSRRISRPRFRLLLPFSGFSDARNFRQGNPNLQPEYTNSVELEYVKNAEKLSFQTSVYYRNRNNVIQRLQFVDSSSINEDFPINIAIPVNLGVENSYGLEFSMSYDIAKWWSVNLNSNIFYSKVTTDFESENIVIGNFVWNVEEQNDDLNFQTFNWNSRFVSRNTLPGDIKFQASFRYLAPADQAQGRRLGFYTIDLGLSKDILNGKGNIALNVSDLLNSRVWRQELETENFVRESEFQWRERQTTLRFSYYINKKPRQQRRSVNDFDGGDDF